jgi:hypothetical protein
MTQMSVHALHQWSNPASAQVSYKSYQLCLDKTYIAFPNSKSCGTQDSKLEEEQFVRPTEEAEEWECASL